MNAREELANIQVYGALIDSKSAQIDRLQGILKKVSGKANTDLISSMIEELDGCIGKYVDLQRDMARYIDKLKKPEHVQVLTGRYLQDKTMQDLSVEMRYSERNLWRIHDQAIEELQLVMDCHMTDGGE